MSAIAPARRVATAAPTLAPPKPPQSRPRLVVVAPRRTSAGRAPFLILIGGLLVVGLVSVLLLHMLAAQDSFRVTAQQQRLATLTDREQQAEQQVAADAAPSALRARARRLGMVPTTMTRFHRLKDGRTVAVVSPVAGATTLSSPTSTNSVDSTTSAKATKATGPTTTKSSGGTTKAAANTKAGTTTKSGTATNAKHGAGGTAPGSGRGGHHHGRSGHDGA